MQCPSCGFENPEGMKFCGECAAPLKNRCPKCGFENPPRFKYCGECATALTGQPQVLQPTQTERPRGTHEDKGTRVGPPSTEHVVPEAERRQLTVLFCDLAGSTLLSEQLDLEELREVVRAYQEVCAKVIHRFEGHIAQYLGDGLLVYFGYPVAHEDDARRAVRTGLGIVEAMEGLNTRPVGGPLRGCPTGIRLAVRVGIHTGLVVVGEMGRGAKREELALGETPNLAARLQELAEPDTVAISSSTHRLIQGFFACQDLGTHALKGISQPMAVYRVLHESAARSRLEVAVSTGLTPLVGREQEMGLLMERWEEAKDGLGQVVVLGGEAGIGKSRLLQVLKEHVANDPQAWLTPCQCSPYHQNSALYPIIELLERVALQFQRDEAPSQKLGKLEGFLLQYGLSLPEAVPLFASLLSIPLPESYAPLNLSPEQQKQKTVQAYLTILLKRAAQQPLLFVVEDLHWVDPSTLELLNLLVDQVPTTRILALFTCRPEFSPPWTGRSHLTQVTLTRLPRRHVEVMVHRVAHGKALPGEVLQQIVAKTDGVPLFVEELTKMVLESELIRERDDHYELTGPLPLLAIPATLRDSLMARLDRLATVKEVAQLGATMGREFTYDLLQAISPLDEATLQHALGRLVEAELLYQRGLPPEARYFFKHALIQEVAYQSLLKSRRHQVHQRIAQVLEERFPETAETQPELLAYHYTEAGLEAHAIDYWQRAGQRALQRSANVEAIGHLTKGLEVLKTLPDSPDRTQRELALQTTLGPALIATKGFAAPEVEKAYARARELCQQVGETPQLFPVLFGLWGFYEMRADLQTARELGKQLLDLAQHQHDPALLLQGHRALGDTLFWLGEFVPARAHLEQGMALYDPQQHRSHAFRYGQDPGMGCRGYAAWVLWMLGYPDQALKRSHEALTLARELSHPFTLAFALHFGAHLHQLRREWQVVQERAKALMALSVEQGFALWAARGTLWQGWALAAQGQVEEGIAQIRQGLAAERTTGTELRRQYWLALLAEACGQMDQIEEGLTALSEALAMVQKNGERFWEAELYRLKGQLLLGVRDQRSEIGDHFLSAVSDTLHSSPEECFRQAVDIARRQNAKSLELRATLSLSRLLQKEGRSEEARGNLSEIYNWFTEGFDTPDLQEAKALLDALTDKGRETAS